MVIVDTNILAYLLIVGERTADAQSLYDRDPDWRFSVRHGACVESW